MAGGRVRVQRVDLPAPDRRVRAAVRARHVRDPAVRGRRAVPARHAARRVRRFTARHGAAQRARTRRRGRGAGGSEGAHSGRDDVRRRCARRAVPARLLRAGLPRQPELSAPSGDPLQVPRVR